MSERRWCVVVFKRLLFPGIAVWLVGTGMSILTCGNLFTWVYQLPPNIWKPPEAMMDPSNMLVSSAVGLFSAIMFVAVFNVLYDGIPGDGAKKGMVYGLLVWVVGSLHGILPMPFYMTISTTVVAYWIVQALVVNLLVGAIVGYMCKR